MPSQSSEDQCIQTVFDALDINLGAFVELGVNNCSHDKSIQCNTHALKQRGWLGHWIDAYFQHPEVHNHFITPWNIIPLLQRLKTPECIDFFSIDIDSTDWYVTRSVLRSDYHVMVYCTEVNGYHAKGLDLVMPVSHQRPQKSRCFGATLLAYKKLFEQHGYTLVAVTDNGVNAFWVQQEKAHLFEHAGDYDHHFVRSMMKNSWNRTNLSDSYISAECLLKYTPLFSSHRLQQISGLLHSSRD